ncbi:ATP-binding protein [Streptomyces sp. MUM 178J]|uniref:ATP-binding protein n=1 Tax=Streptomyces sp. MUM 178J TaxID=2791991 RepID=UPI001F04D3B3|nr:ATP-binding protein [Streptomyces sp. MUM 178J]WRQ80394.1 ATP-binding protein [Streptomyces sp. MUM 178J]
MTATRPGPALREDTAPREDTALREEAEYIFSLPHTPGAVPAVRRRVRAVLADWRLSADAAEDVLLLASELLTNAVVHALPPATLRLSRVSADRRRAVRVEVTDMGPAAPAGLSALAQDPDEHGRGIGIVTALSARCGVREHLGGTGRWAEVAVG